MDEEIILKLQKAIEKSRHKLTIVEGKKDRIAIECLGFNKVIVLNNGAALNDTIYSIPKTAKELIILTDLDKKGKFLYTKISSFAIRRSIKVDNTLRNLLFKTKIRNIESLHKLSLHRSSLYK